MKLTIHSIHSIHSKTVFLARATVVTTGYCSHKQRPSEGVVLNRKIDSKRKTRNEKGNKTNCK